jgi:hypothetical protein
MKAQSLFLAGLLVWPTLHAAELLTAPLRQIPAPGSSLQAAPAFQGSALLVLKNPRNTVIERLTLDGNRQALETRHGFPRSDQTFTDFQSNNGILIDGGENITIRDVTFTGIAGYAILARGVKGLRIERITVTDSGSRNEKGVNNATGGVLIEDGSSNFQVLDSRFERILGNAVWTHSRFEAPRNAIGLIQRNRFDTIGRDAIQAGHATRVQVADNTGRRIGFPLDAVDANAIPVGIDTSGNVDLSTYTANRFDEVNGKCIDLDGFHDGEVSHNTCRNTAIYPNGHFGIVFNNTNPQMESRNVRVVANVIDGMKYGALFLIGRGHAVRDNRFVNLNMAGCPEAHAKYGCFFWPGEPGLLSSGIYLGQRAERPDPSAGIVIEDNVISGNGMAKNCIVYAPGVSPAANQVARNRCQ